MNYRASHYSTVQLLTSSRALGCKEMWWKHHKARKSHSSREPWVSHTALLSCLDYRQQWGHQGKKGKPTEKSASNSKDNTKEIWRYKHISKSLEELCINMELKCLNFTRNHNFSYWESSIVTFNPRISQCFQLKHASHLSKYPFPNVQGWSSSFSYSPPELSTKYFLPPHKKIARTLWDWHLSFPIQKQICSRSRSVLISSSVLDYA